jgi:hypothetical protein
MASFLRPAPLDDDHLGPLVRSRGAWRGTVELDGAVTPLVLPGSRTGPDDEVLALARSIAPGYAGWAPRIRAALAEHADAPEAPLPRPVHAAVVTIDGLRTIELGYELPGDDDHTVGVRLRGGQIVECNGSV